MPSNKYGYSRLRGYRSLLLGALVSFYLSAPVYAFTPSDSLLLTGSNVTPNVILLVDDSGSMNNLIRASAFDQTVSRTQIYNCNSDRNCNSVSTIDMDSENLFYSSFNQGGCSSGYSGFTKGTNAVYCLKLPDPVGSGNTRYSSRYISYLIGLMGSTTTKDYTDGSIPNDYRINVARTTATALVTANRSLLRMGLATFNPPATGNPGPGGYIARAVADLTTTSTTTSTQATTNYNALLSAISGLGAVANTPLAETYYEITRYFRGMAPYYNSSPTTYTSPIQYRCQKNYGVVITDGLPTYDRTFPTNDPLGGTRLPNWDGNSANDGDNLSGDGEGDTLYLDDLAKFAYDIDLRSAANGVDLASKSWDADDFKQQNLLTYTVGFTAANQMLSDAASYGHGKYYQATDAAGLSTALTAALSDIASKAGSGGGGATNTSKLTTSSQYYESFYDPTDWRSTIKAYGFTADGTAVDTSTTVWTTDSTIVPSTASSTTFQSWNNLTSKTIALAYANFAPLQMIALSANLPTGISGSDLVEWSKGTNKTGLRVRTVLLGDIVDSPVVYVAPTDHTASDLPNDTSYSTYLNTKSAIMNPNLVVSGNDGMTSVISTAGARRYAYLPSTTLANLHYVADTGYINGSAHKFLNDGQLNVVDAQLNSSWKTLALGGTGAGGKGFYALQLFDATAGNSIQALWEIRAPDTSNVLNSFNDLGYTYAKAEVARLADGRWAAFIANGYGSFTGRASLFVVDLSTGALISEIVTPLVASGETDNGLSSVKLRVNAQDVVQYAYGGDLKGRMWKFDFTSSTTGAVAFSGTPLFTAPGGATQPITVQPTIGNFTYGRKLIFFGTGKLAETTDKTSTSAQAFYAVMDADTTTANYTVSNLQAQASVRSGNVYTSTSNTVDYTTQKGWYLPVVSATGERIVYAASLTSGRIYFTTAILDASDPCVSSGTGAAYELDAVNGAMITTYSVLGGTSISGIYISGGIPNYAAFVGTLDNSGMATQTVVLQDTGGNLLSFTETAIVSNRRIMWRQRQ